MYEFELNKKLEKKNEHLDERKNVYRQQSEHVGLQHKSEK